MTDTRFGIQFVVTRDGQPITEVIEVINSPIVLHREHDQDIVWEHQIKGLSELVFYTLRGVDALADVKPDMRPVGLQLPHEGVIKRKVGVPILKRVNRVLLALVNRLSASNAKRGR